MDNTVKVGYNQATLTDATIVGVALQHDIAVLKVSPADLPGLRTLPEAAPRERSARADRLGR